MKRQLNGSLFVSIAIHVVIGTAVLHAIMTPRYLDGFFNPAPRVVEPPLERLHYVEAPPQAPAGIAAAPVAAERFSAGAVPSARPLVAPTVIPDGVAPPVAAPPTEVPVTGVTTGTGTGDPGGQGAVSITPAFADPRIWNTPSGYTPPVRTQAENLEEYLARGIQQHLDSVNAAPKQRDPADWTKEIGGRKYGVDQRWIHVGKFKVPTALLGLINVGAQANPNAVDRYRRINEMSSEIAERREMLADSEDEIKRINARMDRQREARLRAKKQAPVVQTEPPARD